MCSDDVTIVISLFVNETVYLNASGLCFVQVKKMAEHSSFVNSCCSARRGPPLIVSGSDDGTAKLWDMRHRGCIQTFPDKYQVSINCLLSESDYGLVLTTVDLYADSDSKVS